MRDQSPPYVVSSIKEGVATLTLSHPTKPNALDLVMQQQLLSAIHRVGADPTARVLIIRSAARAFCVGADLDEMLEASTSQASMGSWVGDWMAQWFNPIVLALQESPVPVLCAVIGAAAGAGAGLAMAGDVLLMSRSSFLLLPFVPKLGLVPDMGCTWFLTRRAGPARAMALALMGDRIAADDAMRLGLAWDVVEDAMFESKVEALAQRLAELPPGAVLDARRAIAAATINSLDAQLDVERTLQMTCIERPAFLEGVRAFLEKRPPAFYAASSPPPR